MKNRYLKKISIYLGISLSFLFVAGCSSTQEKEATKLSPDTSGPKDDVNISFSNSSNYRQVNYDMIEGESIEIDTLYVQVAYELSPERWVLIANSIDEEDASGLKMMLVDPTKDYKLLYQSGGAYESLIFHPSFFMSSDPEDPQIILCAVGQVDSWGQDLFFMKGDSIWEISYLDVAAKVASEEEEYRLEDISNKITITKENSGIYFRFDTDSIKYYGMKNDLIDPIIGATELQYRYINGNLEELWADDGSNADHAHQP
jgi:hypothetical protein